MAKYSYELKREVVKAYQNGNGGYGYIAPKYNISGISTVSWNEQSIIN